MAIQSEVFSTEYSVRSFPSTKHIATKQHLAVWLKKVSDNVWVQLSVNLYELINNSAVLVSAPSSALYSEVEIRVADEPNELGSSQSDIAIVAGLASSIEEIANTIVPNINEILLADDNATIATAKASEATAQAVIATDKALESLNSANASEASRVVSDSNKTATNADVVLTHADVVLTHADVVTTTAQAGIATTKATEASTSASNALTQANRSESEANRAEGFASSLDTSNIVHKTGDETIAGVKMFTSRPIVKGIKVNNDTANGSVEIKAPNVAGDYVVTTPSRNCTIAGEDIVLGVNQTWQNMTASRALGVTYTNPTDRSIEVAIYFSSASAGDHHYGYIDGLKVYDFRQSTAGAYLSTWICVIPPFSTYIASTSGVGTLAYWHELR